MIVEDLRAEGHRILSAQNVAKRVYSIWGDCDLFIDACYSLAERTDCAYAGHALDPLYTDAATAVAQWAELAILGHYASRLTP